MCSRTRSRAAAGVPGPAALGVWVGLWTLLPVAGVFIGALPIVLFAGASSFDDARSWSPLAFVAIGTAEFLFSRSSSARPWRSARS